MPTLYDFGGAEGVEIVYSINSEPTLANMLLDYIGDAGQIKRKAYQRRLPENPSKDYYYIIRETGNAESVLVEYGFIDNTKDAYKLKNNLDNLVEGAVKAIAEYLGVTYTKPGSTVTSEDTYIVKKGDTLYSISKKQNIPIDTIIKLNNLTSSNLQVGQKLKLKSDSNNSISENQYVVQRGDTLYSIALKNNTTVDKLRELNNLNTNTLTIGQILQLPTDNDIEEYDIYLIKKGDSLWSISRNFNIDVNDLIELNNLKDLTLQINQSLLVPKQIEKIETDTYIVKKGDTLWSISNELNIPVQILKDLNNLNSNLLQVGQQLKTK